MKDLVKVSYSSVCEKGQNRKINQDSVMVCDGGTGELLPSEKEILTLSENSLLMVVSDGIGQKKGGEVASKLVVTCMQESLTNLPKRADIGEQMKEAILATNLEIRKKQKEEIERREMGATLTAVYVKERSIIIGQVGDSRAYIIRNERIKQVTKEHSLYQHLLETKAISEETVIGQERHVLLQAMGTEERIQAEISEVEIGDGDIIILCTDGLMERLSDRDIVSVVCRSKSVKQASLMLVKLAKLRGSEDDISVIVARIYFDKTDILSECSKEITVRKILEYEAKGTRNYMRNMNNWMMNSWSMMK